MLIISKMSVQLCEFSVLSYLRILNSDLSGFSWLRVDLSTTLKMYKARRKDLFMEV